MNIPPAVLLAGIESRDAPTIIDVRSRAEYLAGHVPGAVHIPFWATGWRASEVRSSGRGSASRGGSTVDGPVVVYCLYGPRAWMAGELLRLRGFRNVIYLKGHWARWRRQGLREETGDRGPVSG